jgi:hypothetical protein
VLVDSSIDYVIDRSTYTNLFSAVAGSLSSVVVTPISYNAYDTTTYSFSFVNSHQIVQNGKIYIVFPSEITISSPTQSANQCTAIQNIESTFSCSATSSTLTLTGGFASAALSSGSTVQFSVGSITNPVSLELSSSFQVKTQTSADYDIDSISSGVTIKMTTVNNLTSVSLSPDSLVNQATTNIEFTIISSSPLKNGDKIIVTYPTEVIAPSGSITCTGDIALASSLACQRTSTTPGIITLTMTFNTTTNVDAGELIRFKIKNSVNPPTTMPSSTFGFLIINANNYNINTYFDTVVLTTTEANNFSSTSISASNTIPSVSVKITITFTITYEFPIDGIIYVYYPSEVSYDSSQLGSDVINCTTPAYLTST